MQPSRRTVLGGAAAARRPRLGRAPAHRPERSRQPGLRARPARRQDRPARPLDRVGDQHRLAQPAGPQPPPQQQAELVALLRPGGGAALQHRRRAGPARPPTRSGRRRWSRGRSTSPAPRAANPGYDPLAFAVAEAHRRNLEFHAWFNPYRITMNLTTDVAGLSPTHPAKLHPEWTIRLRRQALLQPRRPRGPGLLPCRDHGRGHEVRHRRRPLRRLLLPVPGRRRGVPRRGAVRAVRRPGGRSRTGAATTSTTSSPGSGRPSSGPSRGSSSASRRSACG